MVKRGILKLPRQSNVYNIQIELRGSLVQAVDLDHQADEFLASHQESIEHLQRSLFHSRSWSSIELYLGINRF